MRLVTKILAVLLIVALTVGVFTLLASALRAPEPTVPAPIQIRQGDAARETPDKDRKKKRSRKRPKPAPPPPQDEGARPVAPPPPPAGDDDDDDDDDGDETDD